MSVAYLVVGFALLVLGAEALVRGASRIARIAGVSPLIVGLTVVAFGTSSPELAVSLKASLAGQPDLAVGNVVGSNICNVLIILGPAALIAPLVVSRQLVRLDAPVMIGASLLLYVFAMSGEIGRVEGVALVALLAGYVFLQHRLAKRERRQAVELDEAPPPATFKTVALAGLLTLAGLGLLTLGAHLLVLGATSLARALGVSELIIGLTIVAVGTSLPELATSLAASWRGQSDIAIGNVVGSNIFNIFGVLGVSASVAGRVPVSSAVLDFDLPVMLLAAVACLPIFATGFAISRREGALLSAGYGLYISDLVLSATHSPHYELFTHASLGLLALMVGSVFLGSALGAMQSVRRGAPTLIRGLGEIFETAWSRSRKFVIVGLGGASLLVGLALFVLPGPGTPLVILGLALLSTQFLWARRLREKLLRLLDDAWKKTRANKAPPEDE